MFHNTMLYPLLFLQFCVQSFHCEESKTALLKRVTSDLAMKTNIQCLNYFTSKSSKKIVIGLKVPITMHYYKKAGLVGGNYKRKYFLWFSGVPSRDPTCCPSAHILSLTWRQLKKLLVSLKNTARVFQYLVTITSSMTEKKDQTLNNPKYFSVISSLKKSVIFEILTSNYFLFRF